MTESVRPIRFTGFSVVLLDQTLLPAEETYIEIRSADEMRAAIERLAVRGAPAIGIAAAYGLCLGTAAYADGPREAFDAALQKTAALLVSARPTAVNLAWAISRMVRAAERTPGSAEKAQAALVAEAAAIEREEEASCLAIGEHLLTLLADGMRILTHCNAGGLATIRYGTALSPILLGAERGIRFSVYADETRPLLQGARLTAWELVRAGVPVTVITDSMAGAFMRQGKIDVVITGADRIAANGDVANKIGTYSVAVLARAHGIPFYVAAPVSTLDPATKTGYGIVIEQRNPDEVACPFGRRVVPAGANIENPAFDVTPAELVTAIVTERGILRAPYEGAIAALCAGNFVQPMTKN